MEEYIALNLFVKLLIQSPKPTEKHLQKCEDELKIVKVKTQKVLDLQKRACNARSS